MKPLHFYLINSYYSYLDNDVDLMTQSVNMLITQENVVNRILVIQTVKTGR